MPDHTQNFFQTAGVRGGKPPRATPIYEHPLKIEAFNILFSICSGPISPPKILSYTNMQNKCDNIIKFWEKQ